MCSLISELKRNPLRNRLVHHEFFRLVREASLNRECVGTFIGQWWHPLHYFPTFLARCVAVIPDTAAKCAISRILYQETGEGDYRRAHEVVYVDSMMRAGFTKAEASLATPAPSTAAVVAGYQRASGDQNSALGFIFATEVADFVMVSGLGSAVERVSGCSSLEWVEIHRQQEPDHVVQAESALLSTMSEPDHERLIASAEEMWALWIGFFDHLQSEVLTSLEIAS